MRNRLALADLDSGHTKVGRHYDHWDEYLDRLGDKLLHVHLSDNDGSEDQSATGVACGAPSATYPPYAAG